MKYHVYHGNGIYIPICNGIAYLPRLNFFTILQLDQIHNQIESQCTIILVRNWSVFDYMKCHYT